MRKVKLEAREISLIAGMYRLGATDAEICEAAGITRPTLWALRQRHPELAAAVDGEGRRQGGDPAASGDEAHASRSDVDHLVVEEPDGLAR